MIKTITKVGNSHGIIFDSTLMQMAHLKAGDEVNVEVHSGGTITVTPVRTEISGEEATDALVEIMDRYDDTMRKLAK